MITSMKKIKIYEADYVFYGCADAEESSSGAYSLYCAPCTRFFVRKPVRWPLALTLVQVVVVSGMYFMSVR